MSSKQESLHYGTSIFLSSGTCTSCEDSFSDARDPNFPLYEHRRFTSDDQSEEFLLLFLPIIIIRS
jgi:hypothetical protein